MMREEDGEPNKQATLTWTIQAFFIIFGTVLIQTNVKISLAHVPCDVRIEVTHTRIPSRSPALVVFASIIIVFGG